MHHSLSLTEYSAKHNVSVSTLRRKIKKGQIVFQKERGKYFLPDLSYDELQQQQPPHTTGKLPKSKAVSTPPHTSHDPAQLEMGMDLSFIEDSEKEIEDEGEGLAPLASLELASLEAASSEEEYESSSLEEAFGLALAELKLSFEQVLSEKDNQVLHLRQHIADLQTLNKALEGEVRRLEATKTPSSSPDVDDLKTEFTKYWD